MYLKSFDKIKSTQHSRI